MKLKRPDNVMSQVTEGSPETGTPWRLGMSAEFHLIIFFYLKFFLRDRYRKMMGLNSSSHCGFKANQSKPFPGLLFLWCIYSVRLRSWKTLLRAGLGYPELPLFPSGVPQWLLLKQPGKGPEKSTIAKLARLVCLLQDMSVWLLLCARELVTAPLVHFQPLFETQIRGLMAENMRRSLWFH